MWRVGAGAVRALKVVGAGGAGGRPDLQLHQQKLKLDSMGYKAEEILLMCIWADAVPFNSDRSQSLETISLAFSGQQDLRLPLAGFSNASATIFSLSGCAGSQESMWAVARAGGGGEGGGGGGGGEGAEGGGGGWRGWSCWGSNSV